MKIKTEQNNLIVGGNGQDAFYLTKFLIKKKQKVILLSNKSLTKRFDNSKYVLKKKLDIFNQEKVFKYLKKFKNLKVFFLASHNITAKEKEISEILKKNLMINVIGLSNFLEYARKFNKKIKFFYASSSHIFNSSLSKIQNEKTKPDFNSNYALTKYLGKEICNFYRKKNVFCSVGILYSHISKISKKKFLIKDILEQINNKKKYVKVLDINSKIDLLAAEDAVEAIYRIMNLNKPDDFIISSNSLVSVKEIFNKILLKKKKPNIKIVGIIKSKKNPYKLRGNNRKLRDRTFWRPKKSLDNLISDFVN